MIIQLKTPEGAIILQINLLVMQIGAIGNIADTEPAKSSIELVFGDKGQKNKTYIVPLSVEDINTQILEQEPDYFNKSISK
jgi:hypothetical protein